MRLEKTIEVAGQSVTIFELTVGDIRKWLAAISSGTANLSMIDAMFEGFGTADLLQMSTMTQEEIDTATPSELRAALAVAKEMNEDFFCLLGSLLSLGKVAEQLQNHLMP